MALLFGTHIRDDSSESSGVGTHIGGYSPDNHDHLGGSSSSDVSDSHEQKEEEDDDKRTTILGIPIFKKLLGLGATLGLALLLSQCQGAELSNPFIDVHEENYIEQSDYKSEAEVADLYFSSDEYLRGSQVRSPGELIDELRNASWAEELGRAEGRAEYDARSGMDRVEDERTIQEINEQFEKQTQIIQDSRAIIENPSSTPEQIKNAIKAIEGAKHEQRIIYISNQELFKMYYDRAVKDVESPADDRTEDEVREYDGVKQQYKDGIENLLRDENRLIALIDMYLNPEEYADVFFSESAEERFDAQDRGPILNTIDALGPSGHREIVDEEVTSNMGVHPNDGGQVHEGKVDISEVREVTVQETRYGVSAIFHKIGDFFNELGNKIFNHKEKPANQPDHTNTNTTEKSSDLDEGR